MASVHDGAAYILRNQLLRRIAALIPRVVLITSLDGDCFLGSLYNSEQLKK
jgi:hypothetical protein